MSRASGYRATQSAMVVRIALTGAILLILILAAAVPMPWAARIALILVAVFEAIVAWNLWSMTIEVAHGAVTLSFGPGIFHRSYPVERIAGAQVVKVPWYGPQGLRLGIRVTTMMLSGSAAVQLDLVGGRRILIGCPEPERLVEAIEAERRLASSP